MVILVVASQQFWLKWFIVVSNQDGQWYIFLVVSSVVHHMITAVSTVYGTVFDWTHSSNETRPSTKHPELIDQPGEASNWLKRISMGNQKHIEMVHH